MTVVLPASMWAQMPMFLVLCSLSGVVQGCTVQTVLLEELPQGHLRDAEVPRTPNEVEKFVAGGMGMCEEKLGDGTQMTR